MARRKRVVRKTRRGSRRVSRSHKNDAQKRIAVVINNLLLFIALSLVSFVLFRFLQNDFLINLFQVMAMVFGFVAVGFLITLLILIILKAVSKKGRR